MKTTKIYYERVFSMPGYENKKVGIECQVENDESPLQVLDFAIDFVNKQNPELIVKIEKEKEKTEYENYKSILANPEKYDFPKFNEAFEFVSKKLKNDLPF